MDYMGADLSKVDLLIQYSLLVAGEEDDFMDRDLGPIHLLKYVYLADLAHAERKHGQTFTGIDWQFYKFGPWSQVVHERIDPALIAVNAYKKTFESSYEGKDEWFRWSLSNEQLKEEKERQLPISIISRLKRDIHKYGKDTPGLLDHVYRTPPMLNAAPMELLDFRTAIPLATESEEVETKNSTLSNKKKKLLKQRMSALRDANKKRAKQRKKLINPVTSQRYDEVYDNGVKWLNNLAGEEFTDKEVKASFSDEVWKSSTRRRDELP